MSTSNNFAVLEVRVPGGTPTYTSGTLGKFRRQTKEHLPSDGALFRLFHPTPTRNGLTKEMIAYLDLMASTLVNSTKYAQMRQIVQDSWARQPHEALWFKFHKNSMPLVRLSDSDLIEATSRFTAAHELATRSVIIELQRGSAAESLDAMMAEFKKSITLDLEPIIVTTQAAGGAVITAPTADPEGVTDPAAAAAARREELLDLDWPTSERVSRDNHSTAGNKSQWAASKRAAGELFGVWSARDRTYRHPTFQFDGGLIRPQVKELLSALTKIPGFNATDDAGGWRRAFWLFGAKEALADKRGRPRTPAEVFETDPAAVIALAESDAKVDPNDHW